MLVRTRCGRREMPYFGHECLNFLHAILLGYFHQNEVGDWNRQVVNSQIPREVGLVEE